MSTERSQQDFRPGIYDTPEPEYHADPCPEPSLSAGSAVTVLQKSPLHAWWGSERMNPDFERVEKRHFDIGSAFHARITGVGGPVWRINAPDFAARLRGRSATRRMARDIRHCLPAMTIPFPPWSGRVGFRCAPTGCPIRSRRHE